MMINILYKLKALINVFKFSTMSNKDYKQYLRKHGVRIGNNVRFRSPSTTVIDVSRHAMIEFGDNLDINRGFTVLTHDFGTYVFRNLYNDFVNSWGGVKIGSNIVIGQDVTICKGVTIGDNCIIGIGSLVTKSIPSNSVAMGRPAKVVSSLDDYYRKRKSLQTFEALKYGRAIINKFGRDPQIDDFTEEWVLFLTREEYDNSPIVRQNVDYRLKGYVDIDDFFSKDKPFHGFGEFLKAIKEETKND